MTRSVFADSVRQVRHFLDLSEIAAADLRTILDTAAAIKAAWRRGSPAREKPLAGKALAMIFDKPSTRTRVSFDVGMRQLGGDVVVLTGARCSSAAARRSPTRRASCPASSMPS